MLLGFKTELNPNNKQRTLLAKSAGVSRYAYNWGLQILIETLEHNKTHLENKIKLPTAIDLNKRFSAEVKSEKPWIYEVSKGCHNYATRYVRDTLNNFFKQPDKGFPNFKKKGINDSFTCDGSTRVGSTWVQIPNIGKIRTFERLPELGKVKSFTITKKADKWFVSFKIETPQQPQREPIQAVGVDLGIKSLLNLSNGEVIPNIKPLKTALFKLKQLSGSLSRKVKGTASYQAAKTNLARFNLHVTNIRKDYLHKLTTWLAKTFDVICIEDLNIKGLMKNHKLARAIADLGWFEFRRQLEYKCKLYGSQLAIVSCWYPSSNSCSNCGLSQDLTLSDRVYKCEKCGHVQDRDENAAVNIKQEGLRILKLSLCSP
jgi:putative transposase